MTVPRRVARTRPLEGAVDPLSIAGGVLFSHPDRSLVGCGVAATITIEGAPAGGAADLVRSFMSTIDIDDAVGCMGSGPIAFGALPFAPGARGVLTIPRLVVGRDAEGRSWATTIDHPGDERDPQVALDDAVVASRADDAGGAGPSRFTVRSDRDPDDWCNAVEAATLELRSGNHHKVVLARGVTIEADQPFRREEVLRNLQRAYPSCFLFAIGGFVGASPELLVARAGDAVCSYPMAGTAPRSADAPTDAALAAALLASSKDREEHQITIDMVHDTLLPWCSYLDWEPEPGIVAMANVQHLATRMEGRLSDPPASVLDLVVALHPTPAVGGHPREVALEMIGRLEGLDRDCYSGPVGWVDAHGNGEWAVGIRSAHLDGSTARCFAGVGVVADSDPAAELAETRVKLQALLSALIRP
jgi:isochorismate synthase